jgi:sodium-dependent dicarboxylate transporter 2/3/5
MWVSNTATTLMMVPIAISVISFIETGDHGEPATPAHDRFARGLLISIAYAASIGGLATLIGTPPNAFLAGYIEQNHGIEIGFAEWMLVGLPISAVMLYLAWILLTRVFFRADDLNLENVRAGINHERMKMGRLGKAEKMTAVLFVTVALLWVFRPLLDNLIPISDITIAVAGALAAFLIPVNLRERSFLMNWDHAKKLPWGILLLFGAGLSLAAAIDSTGLAAWLADLLSASAGMPLLAILLLITGFVVFLTEISSNTATAAVFVPVAATFAVSLGLDPMTLAAPAALAASCAFMMPVATPPNAIVFSTGHLTVMQMCRAGIYLNLIATVVIGH